MLERIITSYAQFEPHELQPFQLQLINAITHHYDELAVFLSIIKILDNDMYGHFVLLSNLLHYEMDIRIKTKTNYQYHANNGLPYKLESQKKDDIRYCIEPLVNVVNDVFASLSQLQQCQFYTLYIKKANTGDNGYIKRSLNKSIKTILTKG